MIDPVFKNKTPNYGKLKAFGFVEADDGYVYTTRILERQFQMSVRISKAGDIDADILDPESGDAYVLHRAPGAVGSFVGKVRTDYKNVLTRIAEECFDPDVFKSAYAKKVITYVRETYGDELEYLWQKFSDNAVYRRKDTGKWYAAVLTVARSKLGFDSDELVEIIDLRAEPEALDVLVDHQNYHPGYHMNKKHWYTICLDGSVPLAKVFQGIDESYSLAR
jgi:predicted DNA-binding protein (MmcQ/YjbR family)